MEQSWRTYEEVAAYLLDKFSQEFGLSGVEGKQVIKGHRSGTKWEIDAKGIQQGNEGFVIVECRRFTTSKQNQEKLGSLAYRILDTGAQGGIIVSPFGIQEGAAKIAAAENVLEVLLDANSTPHDFAIKFLNKLVLGVSGTLKIGGIPSAECFRKCQNCGEEFKKVKENEKFCPKCAKV